MTSLTIDSGRECPVWSAFGQAPLRGANAIVPNTNSVLPTHISSTHASRPGGVPGRRPTRPGIHARRKAAGRGAVA